MTFFDEMVTGRFRPKFRQLAEARSVPQMTISRVSGIPYQTVQSYYNGGHELRGLRLNTLYAFLRGLGYSDDEILNLRLGTLFDIVEDSDTGE